MQYVYYTTLVCKCLYLYWSDFTPMQTQQIQHFGYPVEIHEIITDDGYVLQLHRIPHGLYGKSSHNKTVVFLMPGLMCSSGVFVTNGRNKSLAFMLADLNYDVWIETEEALYIHENM